MNIRYETDDGAVPLDSRDDRGATALDPDSMERPAQPRQRKSGFPIDPDRVPGYGGSSPGAHLGAGHTTGHGTGHGTGNGSLRRSSQLPAEPRRSSQMMTDPMAGATRQFQRPRGKRYRLAGEHDPHHTQTFGPAEPLPPSPAAVEATHGWFEPSLRTEAIPDLIGLVGDTSRTYEHGGLSGPHHSAGMFDESEDIAPLPDQRPLLDMQARPYLFPMLLATTCLAVGMVIGALLFGNLGDSGAAAKSDREVIVRCSDPPQR